MSGSSSTDIAVAAVVAEEARLALAERLALLETSCDAMEVIEGPDIRRVARLAGNGAIPYLLDVNNSTSRVAAGLFARRVPYVIDTGDDAFSLAGNLGMSRGQAHARRTVESIVLRAAAAVV